MLNSLAGGDRTSPLAFWGGALAVSVGVALHLPMFFMAADMNYRLAGMPMDTGMYWGMVLIVAGTIAAGYGLLPRPGMTNAPLADLANALPDVARERITRAHWGLLLTLTFALIIDTMKPASLGFVIPGMAAEYGLPRPTIAIVAFFALSGTALGSVIWGVLADRLGRRAAILLAAIMFIGTSICGAMPSFIGNIIMCFLMGLSAGGMLPIAYTLLSELVPARHRGWLVVLVGAVGLFAGYLASSLCAALLEPVFGWRIMWFIGLPTGVMLIGLSQFVPESPQFLLLHGRLAEAIQVMRRFEMGRPPARSAPATKVAGPGLLTSAFAGTTLSLNLAAVAWGLVNFGLILWLPADLRAKGYSVASSDALLARSALLALPTAAITALLYARWSTKGTLMLLSAVTAIGLVGISLLGSDLPLPDYSPVVLISLLMIGTNGIIAVLLPYSTESYPLQIRGRGTGFVAGSSKFGGILVQVVNLAAMVPPLATAAIVLVVPVVASAVLIGKYGLESRGRQIDALAEWQPRCPYRHRRNVHCFSDIPVMGRGRFEEHQNRVLLKHGMRVGACRIRCVKPIVMVVNQTGAISMQGAVA